MTCPKRRCLRAALLAACLLLAASLAWAGPARADLAQSGKDQVYYQVQGKGEPAIVLVHGFCCTGGVWQPNLPGLSTQHKVVTVDLPGHGQSNRAGGEYDLARLAKGVAAAMDAAGVKKAVLIGHSLGGTVIRQVAVDRPDLAGGLVLDDAALDWVPTEAKARADWEQMWRGLIAGLEQDFPKAMQGFVQPMLGPTLSPAQKAAIMAMMKACNRPMAVSIMRTMGDPATWNMAPVPQPTLAIYGTSPYLPKGFEGLLRQRFPNLTYRQWDGVGHFLNMDRPQEFDREVLEWMAKTKF